MSGPQSDESEKDLLVLVAQGKERAMDRCIQQYAPLVWSIARRYVSNPSSAEDVVQETFTDLWKSAKRYDPAVASESTFVGMIARRRAIDFGRRESRQPELEPLPEAELLSHPLDDSSRSLRCESDDVRAALRQLPEETQKLFSLHFDEGMTHPEIAERTGLPLGSVKTRLRRGLIEARDILRRLEGPKPRNIQNS